MSADKENRAKPQDVFSPCMCLFVTALAMKVKSACGIYRACRGTNPANYEAATIMAAIIAYLRWQSPFCGGKVRVEAVFQNETDEPGGGFRYFLFEITVATGRITKHKCRLFPKWEYSNRGRETMKFIHTADWQIGKPFAGVADAHKRSLVQQERIEVIKRIGRVAQDNGAAFVLVAGDLFDSPSADKATVSAACSAIGQIGVPVLAIPGNHDHAGPGSVWEQPFFQREREALAPNLSVLLDAVPLELESSVVLPCPLLRRAVMVDPTDWLRATEAYAGLAPDKPRIVLAHGSTQMFSGQWADDEEGGAASNLLDLSRLPATEIDYIALGDWHGSKQIDAKAWYAGTPELDRFPKGGEHDPGNLLIVEARRGGIPQVTRIMTARLKWNDLLFDLAGDESLNTLQERLTALLGSRANEDLLRLTLTGAVGIEAANRLEQLIESLVARLLRVKMTNRTLIAPTEAEVQALTVRSGDPLIASVARKLVEQAVGESEEAQVARTALRELHAVCMQEVRT